MTQRLLPAALLCALVLAGCASKPSVPGDPVLAVTPEPAIAIVKPQ
ncbi:MAG: DUF1615 domain-containing protein, partial [Polaromonas sp.]|nr:DUF1615 domain-containing protein [Polaromonas sp.]